MADRPAPSPFPSLLGRLATHPGRVRDTADARPSSTIPRRRNRSASARTAIILSLLVFFAASLAFSILADVVQPTLRDPEYGKKLTRLTARSAAHPDRPLVVVLGSSRVAMGVKPPAVEDAFEPTHRPVVANMSLLGSGPLMQLLVYDRLRRAGIRPAAVVAEYWPVLARTGDREEHRIDIARLFPADYPALRDFFQAPDVTRQSMGAARRNPWTASRARLVGLIAPEWLPPGMRVDVGWMSLDADGWKAGRPDRAPVTPELFDHHVSYYAPRLADTVISDESDRAIDLLAARCREDGVPLAIAWLPESTRFRALYSARTEATVTSFWYRLTAEGRLPGIDLRTAMPDHFLPDGFHLTQNGAAAFGPVLATELRRVFPHLGRGD